MQHELDGEQPQWPYNSQVTSHCPYYWMVAQLLLLVACQLDRRLVLTEWIKNRFIGLQFSGNNNRKISPEKVPPGCNVPQKVPKLYQASDCHFQPRSTSHYCEIYHLHCMLLLAPLLSNLSRHGEVGKKKLIGE